MKKMLFLTCILSGTLFLAGCGDGVDENKTPAQIQQETIEMNVDQIKDMIAKYQKAISQKTNELKKEMDKLANIPLQEQMGSEAKKVRAEIEKLSNSLNKLKANAQTYAEELSKKK